MAFEPLTEAELIIVREGLAAADLLASEPLRSITHSLMVEAFSLITESAPADTARREHTYNLIRGLKAIEAELHARVQRKASIERRLDAENADDAVTLIDDAALGVPE